MTNADLYEKLLDEGRQHRRDLEQDRQQWLKEMNAKEKSRREEIEQLNKSLRRWAVVVISFLVAAATSVSFVLAFTVVRYFWGN